MFSIPERLITHCGEVVVDIYDTELGSVNASGHRLASSNNRA
jgi:hypothetical protein